MQLLCQPEAWQVNQKANQKDELSLVTSGVSGKRLCHLSRVSFYDLLSDVSIKMKKIRLEPNKGVT